MFLRCHKRKKNGKLHQYYSVVENRRLANGRVAQKNRLYQCLDNILPCKDELCRYLKARRETLFDISYDVLLYDLTSTYFEGLCVQNPKAQFGHSKDRRSDCRQVLIALIVARPMGSH